jgi:hypothetical protein
MANRFPTEPHFVRYCAGSLTFREAISGQAKSSNISRPPEFFDSLDTVNFVKFTPSGREYFAPA